MATYKVMNYIEEQADIEVAEIVTNEKGEACLSWPGCGESVKFRNLNLALTAAREKYGWPDAYLERYKNAD